MTKARKIPTGALEGFAGTASDATVKAALCGAAATFTTWLAVMAWLVG